MRYIDNSYASFLQVPDDPEQMLNFHACQRRGRLIHDNNAGMKRNGLRDFNGLDFGYGQLAHQGFGIQIDIQILEKVFSVSIHFLVVNELKRSEAFCRKTPQPDVLHHIAERNGMQLLVYHGDSVAQSIIGIRNISLFTIQKDFTGIR
ncbi:hypothetical protein D3C75_908120 [compost metagenome]